MVPVVQPAISLFGASLGPGASGLATPPVNPDAAKLAGLGAGLGSELSPLASATGMATAAVPSPFADLLVEAVSEVQSLQNQAKGAIQGLISGKGVDVHEAMIAAQKAGIGFELALSVRNKALSAYQQVMGMQF